MIFRKKTIGQLDLTNNQLKYFDRFLVNSTCNILEVLETMFSLNIDGSDSTVNLIPGIDIENVKQLSGEPLLVISSELAGELQGSLTLLMTSTDFKKLGEVLKPTLKLLFLSSPGTDLSTSANRMWNWTARDKKSGSDESAFIAHMMDTSKELGNVIFGVYTDAIYKVFDLHTQHTLPEFSKNTNQQHIHEVLASEGLLDKQNLVIENDFTVLDKSFCLWCLISPSKKSLKVILDRVG